MVATVGSKKKTSAKGSKRSKGRAGSRLSSSTGSEEKRGGVRGKGTSAGRVPKVSKTDVGSGGGHDGTGGGQLH